MLFLNAAEPVGVPEGTEAGWTQADLCVQAGRAAGWIDGDEMRDQGAELFLRKALVLGIGGVVERDIPLGVGAASILAAPVRGLDLEGAGRVASLAATYAVEQVGTIEHGYTRAEFSSRYLDAFDVELPEKFWPDKDRST